MRAETGLMNFEGDWTGVFIRGDNAMAIAQNLQQQEGLMFKGTLHTLIRLLSSVNERDEPGCQTGDVQRMRRFEEAAKQEAPK